MSSANEIAELIEAAEACAAALVEADRALFYEFSSSGRLEDDTHGLRAIAARVRKAIEAAQARLAG